MPVYICTVYTETVQSYSVHEEAALCRSAVGFDGCVQLYIDPFSWLSTGKPVTGQLYSPKSRPPCQSAAGLNAIIAAVSC